MTVAGLVVLASTVSACADDPAVPVAPTASGSGASGAVTGPAVTGADATDAAASEPATGQEPTASRAEPSGGTTREAVPVAPDATSTAARTSQAPAEVVRLLGVQVSAGEDAETVRFRTAGGSPGFDVAYVDAVRVEGEPVLVEGAAVLEVVLVAADPDGEEGLSPEVAVSQTVDQELVREVRFARYVDGVVTFAIGLSEEAAYTVTVDDDGLLLTFVG